HCPFYRGPDSGRGGRPMGEVAVMPQPEAAAAHRVQLVPLQYLRGDKARAFGVLALQRCAAPGANALRHGGRLPPAPANALPAPSRGARGAATPGVPTAA